MITLLVQWDFQYVLGWSLMRDELSLFDIKEMVLTIYIEIYGQTPTTNHLFDQFLDQNFYFKNSSPSRKL